jgi:hypothetical protein
MSTHSRLFQRLGALGIVFSALFVVANFLIGNGAKASSSGTKVISYYRSHRTSETAAVFVIAFAVLAFTFFLGALRRRLDSSERGRPLSAMVTAGGAVYVVGLLLQAVFTLTLVDAAHDRMAAAAQTINVLQSDDWVPVVVGLSILALGTGIAALLTRSLPRWLAWTSIGLGGLAVAGPLGGVAFLLAPVWTLVTAIVLLRASPVDAPAPSAGSAASVLSPAAR